MYTHDNNPTCSSPYAARPAQPTPSTNAAAEDLRLIRRIVGQDSEAFEILYRRYAPHLASFLFPLLQDAALIDEVINATLFVVWQKAATFRPSARLSTWIFGIARKKALKAFKRSTAQRPDRLDTSVSDQGPANPETLCMQQEQAQMVAQALCTLPSHLREVVEGAYGHMLTYPEIAKRLSCSTSTVKNRLDRARRRLASQLRHGAPSDRGRGSRLVPPDLRYRDGKRITDIGRSK